MMSNCKNCLSNNVEILFADEIIKYKGKEIPFSIEYSLCSDCAHEFVSSEQISRNDVLLRDDKKAIDGLLTSKQIKQARKQLKLTQEQAALVFGGGKNAFSKYERAEVSQSVAMDKLIKACMKFPELFESLLLAEGIVMDTDGFTYKDNIIDHPCLKIDNKNIKTKKKAVLSERDYG